MYTTLKCNCIGVDSLLLFCSFLVDVDFPILLDLLHYLFCVNIDVTYCVDFMLILSVILHICPPTSPGQVPQATKGFDRPVSCICILYVQ